MVKKTTIAIGAMAAILVIIGVLWVGTLGSLALAQVAHTKLKSDYDFLKKNYDNMTAIIAKGEAVAKSATWFSEDKRVRVTSEVVPDVVFGSIVSYKIRVTLVNVANRQLDVVWIFLYAYNKDGNLVQYWNPIGYIKSVERLHVGETYTYTFEMISKETATYKVFVAVG